jgi:hypothetical protein
MILFLSPLSHPYRALYILWIYTQDYALDFRLRSLSYGVTRRNSGHSALMRLNFLALRLEGRACLS